MHLIASERAVLGLIRTLFQEGSQRLYRLTVLQSRWPPSHFEAYKLGYLGLVSKGLLEETADGRSYRITEAGYRAMGERPA